MAQAAPGAGLLKGLGVTLKHMFRPAATAQYPHVRPDLPPRTRGVIALMDENCTVCMLCSRECPDWCIYIDSHKETVPPAKEGGRARTRNVLDRFAIDFALCMYCGICVEVCPFDALFWSPEFEYSEYSIAGLLHEKPKLREWMDTVLPPPPLDDGAESVAEVADALEKVQKELEAARQAEERQAEEAAQPAAAPASSGGAAKSASPTEAQGTKAEQDIEVEAGEIDQETFDQLIAEGKSERMARAKAKAAYVRKKKAEIRAQREAEVEAGGEAAAPTTEGGATPAEAASADVPDTPAEAPPVSPTEAPSVEKAEVHVEAGEIDQETYDQLIAEGKSERIARAKAKAAYVRKRKKELSEGGDA
jgi:NADH-quinone oxidoreductase subunit I